MGPKPLNTPQRLQRGLRSKARFGKSVPAEPRQRRVLASDSRPAAVLAGTLPTDMALDGWDSLLTAVKAGLRQAVGEPPTTPLNALDRLQRVRSGVLECAAALDQLHATLAHELARHRHLDQEVEAAQAALAQTRAELAGTQAEELRARHLALHDSLTTLPNRSFFRERLQHALEQAGPRPTLAVLYLDLDGFKSINDQHGHATGDELLRIVAARLARAVRAEDAMSRLGGDEFGCLPTSWCERAQLAQLAHKLIKAVSAPLKCGALRLSVRPSIGIAVYPGDGESADELLENADAAMYRAKRQRSGHAFFDEQATA